MNVVKIKNITIGEGAPKICVPLVAADLAALRAQIEALAGLEFDLVEFRADFLKEVEDADYVMGCLAEIRRMLPDTPLLFTFRTAVEGGEHAVAAEYYFALLHAAIGSGHIDLADIELFAGEEQVKAAVALAKAKGVAAVLCNHDFDKTPSKAEIISRLRCMQDWGADICKIAVMPQSDADVLVLLDATETMYREHAVQPLITMAMGQRGIISRLAGAVSGSAVTFGAAGKASAPGQIAANDLRFILNVLTQKV
ncbi:type I 3-dehydroquinate dehydratase [Uruburuella testudinis]|uniref:3-dehydroquinate dehydratase n=1 Tax=Uruburuella testudinis TaxID=1282863 RepID=A0ABY4E1Y6_9NEIS|nr:type I 3-dehydroquinate dehydratase [Uruburuella testudinis]UOO82971.1 type I 3-dehydroquinate dehydratase [Uruburuella testudinis]